MRCGYKRSGDFAMGNWTTRERARNDTRNRAYRIDEGISQEIPLIHTHPVLSLCVADSTHIITSCTNKTILVYEWAHHNVKHSFELPNKPATRVVYHTQNQLAYAASRDGNIYKLKWPTENQVNKDLVTLTGHTLSVTGLATNHFDLLVSGSRDNTVKIWSLDSHSCISSIHISRNLVTDLKWMKHDKNCVLQSSEDKSLRIWDTRNCSVVNQVFTKQHIQLCCAVSDCGNYIASGSSGQQGMGCEITLWDRRNIGDNERDGLIREFKGHSGSVNNCMFLSIEDTNMIASCSNDSTVKVWDKETGDCLLSEYVPGAGPISDMVSPSSPLIACSTFNKGVKIWGLKKSQTTSDYLLELRANY